MGYRQHWYTYRFYLTKYAEISWLTIRVSTKTDVKSFTVVINGPQWMDRWLSCKWNTCPVKAAENRSEHHKTDNPASTIFPTIDSQFQTQLPQKSIVQDRLSPLARVLRRLFFLMKTNLTNPLPQELRTIISTVPVINVIKIAKILACWINGSYCLKKERRRSSHNENLCNSWQTVNNPCPRLGALHQRLPQWRLNSRWLPLLR